MEFSSPVFLIVLAIAIAAIIVACAVIFRPKKKADEKPQDASPVRATVPPRSSSVTAVDPFDGSPLTDPMPLSFDHPERGTITVMANRNNALYYALPQHRQRALRTLAARGNDAAFRNHRVMSYYTPPGQTNYVNEGPTLLDYYIWWNLFQHDPVVIERTYQNPEAPFVPGGGGDMGGGGAQINDWNSTPCNDPAVESDAERYSTASVTSAVCRAPEPIVDDSSTRYDDRSLATGDYSARDIEPARSEPAPAPAPEPAYSAPAPAPEREYYSAPAPSYESSPAYDSGSSGSSDSGSSSGGGD